MKAYSGVLRTRAARDAASVRAFLTRHASAISPRVLREVRTRLAHGRKVRRRDT